MSEERSIYDKKVSCAVNEAGTHLCIEDNTYHTKCIHGILRDCMFYVEVERLMEGGFNPQEVDEFCRLHPQNGISVIISNTL